MQDDEIGVLPGGDRALAGQAEDAGGVLGRQARDVLPAEALDLPDLRGQQRQQQAVARGAVHRLEEPGPRRLERRGPGGVVGGDDLERAVHERRPRAPRGARRVRSGGLMTKSPGRSPR